MDKTALLTSFFPQTSPFQFLVKYLLPAWLNHLLQDRLIGLHLWAPIRIFPKGEGAARKVANKLVFKPFKNICTDCCAAVDHYIVIFFIFIWYTISFFSIFISFCKNTGRETHGFHPQILSWPFWYPFFHIFYHFTITIYQK